MIDPHRALASPDVSGNRADFPGHTDTPSPYSNLQPSGRGMEHMG